MKIVTCKKCKKNFDYDKYMGVCPKCCHYYSNTSYDDDLKYETNILSSSSSDRCSYHGAHIDGINSGHSENLHDNYSFNNISNLEKEKEEIARRLREKYNNNPPNRANNSNLANRNVSYMNSYQEGVSTRPRNVNLRNADIRYNEIKQQSRKSKNIVTIIFVIFLITQFAIPLIFGIFTLLFEIFTSFS